MVSGTTRRSCARARRSISISRLSFLLASPSRAFWQMARNCPSSTLRSRRSSRSASPRLAGVVVAQHALDVGGGQDLADDVEDGVVVQRVADLLQLLEQPLQDAAFDGVGGHEVEDQAVLALAVAVDAAHPLLEAVRVPGDVVVEEDVADLEVDALARRLGGDQDLDLAFPELLLGVEARARLVARARLHAAVDAADAEAPRLQPIHQIVQRVLELGEEEQALVRVVEEAFLLEQVLELRELGLGAGVLDGLGLGREAPQLLRPPRAPARRFPPA